MGKWRYIIFGGRVRWRNLVLMVRWRFRKWFRGIGRRYQDYDQWSYICSVCQKPHNIAADGKGYRIDRVGGATCPACMRIEKRAARVVARLAQQGDVT